MTTSSLTAFAASLAHNVVKGTLRRDLAIMRNELHENHCHEFLSDERFAIFWNYAMDLPPAMRDLASQIESACSPANVIPQCRPLGDSTNQPNVAELVHNLYVRKGAAEPYKNAMMHAASSFEDALRTLRNAVAEVQPLESSFDDFEKAIDVVEKALHEVPQGILLP